MKKFVITIMFGLAISVVCSAQNNDDVKHHEIYAGIGLLNDNQVFSMAGDLAATVLTVGSVIQPDTYGAFTPSVGYRHWFNRRIGIGGHFAFDKNSVKVLDARDLSTTADDEWHIHNRYFYTFALDFNWNYLNGRVCQLYGNIGAGVTVVGFSDNDAENPDARITQVPFPNFHLSPLGIRIGRKIAGFAEIGWGYKGFINVGISAKF